MSEDAHELAALTPEQSLGLEVLAAARQGKAGVPKALDLLRQGASVRERDEYGRTALSYAATRNHKELVEALLARGADPDVQDSSGDTPLMGAMRNCYPVVAKMLIDAGADIALKNLGGQTAMDLALERHNERNAGLLRDWSKTAKERPVFLAWLKDGLPAQNPVAVNAPLKLKRHISI